MAWLINIWKEKWAFKNVTVMYYKIFLISCLIGSPNNWEFGVLNQTFYEGRDTSHRLPKTVEMLTILKTLPKDFG